MHVEPSTFTSLRVCSASTREICKSGGGGVAVGVSAATSRPLPAEMYRK